MGSDVKRTDETVVKIQELEEMLAELSQALSALEQALLELERQTKAKRTIAQVRGPLN